MSPTLTRIVTLGCVGVIGAVDTAYLSWLLLRAQHHARAWHRWRRRNSVVKVILAPPEIEKILGNVDDPDRRTDDELRVSDSSNSS